MPNPKLSRQKFFDKQVHMQIWKDSMAGKNEENVIKALNSVGFNINEDFKRQHPIASRFVIDIAFVNEQVALEVDGQEHSAKERRKLDKKRDRFFRENNWIPIRIKQKQFFGYKALFYKYLIRDIVAERRQQFKNGKLYPIEIPDFNDND